MAARSQTHDRGLSMTGTEPFDLIKLVRCVYIYTSITIYKERKFQYAPKFLLPICLFPVRVRVACWKRSTSIPNFSCFFGLEIFGLSPYI